MSILCGIDYSSSSAAIYIEEDGVGKWYLKQKTLKHVQETAQLSIVRIKPFERKIDRAVDFADWALSVLVSRGIKETNIEGFSLGSNGGMVFDIGAHSGILYVRLKDAGIKINLIPPTSAKKSFSGKGNAGKDFMCETFKKKFGFAFSDILGTKPNESPENDLVDAYAVAHSVLIHTKKTENMFC